MRRSRLISLLAALPIVLLLAPIALADGGGDAVLLPAPQSSVVVKIEKGVRVWRPVTGSYAEGSESVGYADPDTGASAAAPATGRAVGLYGGYGYGIGDGRHHGGHKGVHKRTGHWPTVKHGYGKFAVLNMGPVHGIRHPGIRRGSTVNIVVTTPGRRTALGGHRGGGPGKRDWHGAHKSGLGVYVGGTRRAHHGGPKRGHH